MKAKVVNMSWHGGDLEIGRAGEGKIPLKYWLILNKQTGHAHSTALIKSKSVAQITEVWRAEQTGDKSKSTNIELGLGR